jgi:glucose-1-phosphate cytidylyltransferase
MKVLILCGGMGTRLREHTETRPKPMVDVGGRPILWHIMRTYAHHGFREFVLCLGYKGNVIREYFLNYEAMNCDFTLSLGELGKKASIELHERENGQEELGWKVTLAETGEQSMTGARVKRGSRYVPPNETFAVTYGDGVSDVDLQKALAFHRSHGKLATVTGVRPPSRFGELYREGSKVLAFSEKPQLHEGLINGGFFFFEPAFLQYITDDVGCVLEKDPLERCAADGQLMVYEHAGYWQCMDTYRDWESLEKQWQSGRAPWKVWSPG